MKPNVTIRCQTRLLVAVLFIQLLLKMVSVQVEMLLQLSPTDSTVLKEGDIGKEQENIRYWKSPPIEVTLIEVTDQVVPR